MKEYEDWRRQLKARMLYICQKCGHLMLIAGEHCQHCHFAPKNVEEANLAVSLSTTYFKVIDLLTVALEVQRGRHPYDICRNLRSDLSKWDVSKEHFILQKIGLHTDDYLDFNFLNQCTSCGSVVWPSWVDSCPTCNAVMDRPQLMRLAVCVENLLQQFIWNIRRGADETFARFITLLVNMKYLLTRAQEEPTDSQKHAAMDLLIKLSPLYTQNGAGVVRINGVAGIESEVLDPNSHKDIVPTMKFLEGELRHFAYLMSDDVSLF